MAGAEAPLRRVRWPKAHRIIRSIHPPIDLFEDISDPADWDLVASGEAKTNPRAARAWGDLALVPPERRVGGPGSSLVMAPFVHVSTDRPGRFSAGRYGVFYAARSEETALREVAYHHGRFMAATGEAPGWTSQFRQLLTRLDLDLHDVDALPGVLDADDWSRGQEVGRALRAAGSNGVVFSSVRHAGGSCAGIFWPDLVEVPVQGTHYDFHWNGSEVDYVRDRETSAIYDLAA